MLKDNELLSVYSASAGSGKTYTLAQQFIDLLARNPHDYEHILAVTFTKKATAEMKERIIENLALLAYEAKDETSHVKRESMMAAQLKLFESHGKNLKEDELANAAHTALLLILNDYGQFNVNTIDSFVQKVIRAFAFEAGLSSQFGIEIDANMTIDQAIDELMLNLQIDKELREWLVNLMRYKLEENESAQIEKELKAFANDMLQHTSCNGMKHSKQEIEQFAKEIDEIRTNFEKKVAELARSFVDSFRKAGGESVNLELGKRNWLWKSLKPEAIKLTDSDFVQNFIKDTESQYFNRKDDKIFCLSKNCNIANSDYFLKFKNLQKYLLDNIVDYNTANAIRKNIFIVGLLSDISKIIDDIANREKMMPISNSNLLLHNLIDGSSVPFIYEKIGTRFKHIMIDEFQDTSLVQWENFRPLVQNSLDQHNECLIVGDVKQSIYRWRNSDWRLLANSLDANCQGFVKHESLDTNWRSLANIINFNNKIIANLCDKFSSEVGKLTETESGRDAEIDMIYANSAQKIPSSKVQSKGFVQMRFANANKKNGKKEIDESAENEEFMTEFIDAVKMLHEQYKYSYSDICVLTRKNKEAQTVIEELSKNDIPAISNEALLICNSQSVSTIISHLKYIADPNDRPSLAHVAVFRDGNNIDKLSSNWDLMLKKESYELLKLRGLGLIEMVDAIVERLPKEYVKQDFIFIEAFKEQLRSYIASKHVNLQDFMNFISEKRNSLSVTAPENQDAVTVTTIHKSKGLQYKAVLMPYADWQIIGSSNGVKTELLWVDLDDKFGKISPIPLMFSSKLERTRARSKYLKECQLRIIDNLNLIYVAFTRAEEVLMTWSSNLPDEFEFKSSTTIAPFLKVAAENVANEIENSSYITENELFTFNYGEIDVQCEKSDVSSETEVIMPCESKPWSNRIRISMESEKARQEKQNKIIAKGNMMHSIMENIMTFDDVHRAVNNAKLDGQLDEKNAAIIEQEIMEHISSDEISSWFDGSQMRVLTETDFMTKDGDSRPDRIMIDNQGVATVVDYKFGEKHTLRYEEQVRRYMTLLNSVGFSEVEGFLWYYNENQIVKVEKMAI